MGSTQETGLADGTRQPTPSRRRFLGAVAAGIGALSVGGVLARRSLAPGPGDADLLGAAITASGAVRIEMQAKPQQIEVAPGVRHDAWTFGGTVPGPVVRLREGDVVEFTLRNDDPRMPHSIDFHAARTPPDRSFRDVLPGQRYTFVWRADVPGVFMYHCGTAPVLMHIANGMYGAVVVDPATPREPAREYVLVQGEWYAAPEDLQSMLDGPPRYVVFNGRANRYLESPLEAKPGELIRLYVVNAGPNRFSAFHVVGAIFERVEVDADPSHALRGVQTYTVPPGGGAVFELTIPDEGEYAVVTHSFSDATRGAIGKIRVTRSARDLPLMP